MEYAHFRLVIGSGCDLGGAVVSETAVVGRAVANAEKFGLHAQRLNTNQGVGVFRGESLRFGLALSRFFYKVWLAVEPLRRARRRRDVAEPDASLLASRNPQLPHEKRILSEDDRMRLHLSEYGAVVEANRRRRDP